MRSSRLMLGAALFAAGLSIGSFAALASPFVVFPKAGELVSPDGHFAVRNIDAARSASDFVGTFHALWLLELATGRSRKLCDYVGVASAAWSNNNILVVNQYLSRRTSRVLVFSANAMEDPVMLDKVTLTRLVPVDLRPALRENDHVFIEGSRVEQDTLHLTVWGYGQHAASGFRYHCEYTLREGAIDCHQER
jgi:hypothetical protein